MYKIGDFSQLGQVTVRTLRHYDRLGLLTPSEIDQFTNYRYYTAQQLPRLNRILALRDLGFSLEDIGRMLEEEITVDKMQSLLSQKQREIEEQLRAESARLRRVSARLQQLERDREPFAYDVIVKSVPEICLLAVRSTVPDVEAMGEYRDRSLKTLYKWLDDAGIEYGQEIVAYHNRSYTMENIEMSIGVEVDSASASTLDLEVDPADLLSVQKVVLPAANEAAGIVISDSILNVPNVISALYGWMGTNGYTSAGSHREIHLFGRELEILHGQMSEALSNKDLVYEILVPIERF